MKSKLVRVVDNEQVQQKCGEFNACKLIHRNPYRPKKHSVLYIKASRVNSNSDLNACLKFLHIIVNQMHYSY